MEKYQPKGVNNHHLGFTLIELMVTIGIMSIMMAIAIPNYSAWRERTAAQTSADTLVSHLKQARIKAVTERRCVEVRFDMAAPAYTVDNTGKQLLVNFSQYSKHITLTTTIATAVKGFVFNSNGTAKSGACGTAGVLGSITIVSPANSHKVTVNGVGRVYQE